MNPEELASVLLARWDELRHQGESAAPEALCRECPEALPLLKKRIEAIEAVENRFAARTGSTDSVKDPDATTGFGGPTGPAPVEVEGYEILSEIGRGGMGVVYKARQLPLGRLVALKMIRFRTTAGVSELARFRTEAEAVARLQHPCIIQIHEIGEHDGQPFMCLEYCAGGSLARKMGGVPTSSMDAARLTVTLAEALQAAHEQQIVHRDLKPANILLTSAGTPKISDFGLAKKLDDEAGQTQSGEVMGTPSYMAPEQASGNIRAIGPATDVYALGAILYEALTGRPPFRAPTPMETVLQVLREEPVSPRRLQPGTPRDLETICLKCLRKEPEGRYGTARDLAADLQRFLAGRPIVARPAGRTERLWKWAVRNPVVAVLSGFLVALLFLAAVGTYRFVVDLQAALQGKSDEFDRAEAEKANAQAALAKAQDAASAARKAENRAERERDQAAGLLMTSELQLVDRFYRTPPGKDPTGWRYVPSLDDPDVFPMDRRDFAWRFYHHALSRRSEKQSPKVGSRGTTGEGFLEPFSVVPGTHRGNLRDGAFSPDGLFLATCGGDGMVRIWDAAAKSSSGALDILGQVRCLAVHPDGKTLAVGVDKRIEFRDALKGHLVGTLHLKGFIYSLEFDRDGRHLLTTAQDTPVSLWDVDRKTLLRTFRPLDPPRLQTGSPALAVEDILAVHFHPRRNWIAAAASRFFYVWDSETGTLLHRLPRLTGRFEFSPDGSLCVIGLGNALHVLDARTFTPIRARSRIATGSESFAILPDNRTCLVPTPTGVDLWDLASLRKRGRLPLPPPPFGRGATGIRKLAVHPSGERVVGGLFDGSLIVWEAPRPTRLAVFPGKSLTLDPVGGRIAEDPEVGDTRLRIRLLPGGSTEKILQVADLMQWVDPDRPLLPFGLRRVFTADGRGLIAGGHSGLLRLWNTDSWEPEATWVAGGGQVVALTLSSDGKTLVSVGASPHPPSQRGGITSLVTIWSLPDRTKVGTLPNWKRFITRIALSPDGRTLAIHDERNETIELWDVPTITLRHTLPHGSTVWDLAFSPDGNRLAACWSRVPFSAPGKEEETSGIRYWNPRTGEEIHDARLPSIPARIVCFHPRKELVLVGTRMETVVWDTAEGRVSARLPHVVGPFAWTADDRFLFGGTGMYDFERLLAEAAAKK